MIDPETPNGFRCTIVHGASCHILIVDDSEDELFLTRRLLEQAGFAGPLAVARSAAEAMVLMQSESPLDLAFLDIRMPLMDGLELLQWIRTQPIREKLKVVMLTSSDDARDVERARKLGADGYLLKSCSPEKCAAILATVVPDIVPG